MLAMPALAQAPARPVAAAATSPQSTVPAPQVTPQEAERALETLQDDQKRAALVETLKTIAAAAPEHPAAAPASPAAIGRQVLVGASDWLSGLSRELAAAAGSTADIGRIRDWAVRAAADPGLRSRLSEIAWRLGLVLAAAFVARFTVELLTRRPFAALDRRAGRLQDLGLDAVDARPDPDEQRAARVGQLNRIWRSTRLLPLALGRLALDLAPVLAFAAIGNLLLGTPIGSDDTARLVILAVVNAYVLCLGILCAARLLVSPDHPRLRLLPITTETATYIEIWVRRMAVVVTFGVALAEVALLLGLDPAAHDAIIKAIGLVAHLFAALIVVQSRHGVARLIRAPRGTEGLVAGARNRLAAVWHILAVGVIMAQWFVWASALQDGDLVLFHYASVTVAVLAVSWLAGTVILGLFDRIFRIGPDLAERVPGIEARANRYYPALHALVASAILLMAMLALLQAWGVDAFGWFAGGTVGGRIVSALLTIALATLVAAAVWEASNLGIEAHLARLRRAAMIAQAARWQTLLPMLRSALLVVVLAVVAMTVLSQIGVNIGPLLAGAGIVGIAVGFGSQKLVQDLITGIFLLLENAMQVGDNVTVGGLSGTVEALSIRTIRLRAGDGAVHIIPFSSVTSVTNTNRGVGNAAVVVDLDYREDTDRVGQVLSQIADQMRGEPAFEKLMRGGLDLWGVDKVEGSTVTLAGQIVCTDAGRWAVQREFNRRMKLRFQELGIAIANPNRTIVLQRADPPPDADPTPIGDELAAARGRRRQ
jgi:small-conductance mechanosensitive channel